MPWGSPHVLQLKTDVLKIIAISRRASDSVNIWRNALLELHSPHAAVRYPCPTYTKNDIQLVLSSISQAIRLYACVVGTSLPAIQDLR
ncbi:hypothetical protein GY45DRAFT_1126045 [Cubamyces sp. BRFM 1775]|nr:hypothetical protein GY45DRAFT_1126045 [Cubamyces sp. BRFM 1775]